MSIRLMYSVQPPTLSHGQELQCIDDQTAKPMLSVAHPRTIRRAQTFISFPLIWSIYIYINRKSAVRVPGTGGVGTYITAVLLSGVSVHRRVYICIVLLRAHVCAVYAAVAAAPYLPIQHNPNESPLVHSLKRVDGHHKSIQQENFC